jgi:hypothetical protein
MAVKYAGFITVDPSVLTAAQRTKMSPVVVAMMEKAGVYDPVGDDDNPPDAAPNAAAQSAFVTGYLETVLLSNVRDFRRNARKDAVAETDVDDEL